MKKIFMGAAIASMMFASCQNEMVENSAQQEGKTFTLVVNKDAGSRTALKGLQTVWSEGDQIYVTSKDGSTTGVLTLQSGADGKTATFKGLVFGNGKLEYSVFPVPSTVKDMSQYDATKLDAPMTGIIEGNSSTMAHSVGLVKLQILGLEAGEDVIVEAENIGSKMRYSLAENQWVNDESGDVITIENAVDGEYLYIPVCLDAPASRAIPTITLKVTIGSKTPATMTVKVSEGAVNADAPILAVTENAVVNTADPASSTVLGDDYTYVSTVEEMKNAIRGEEGPAYVVIKKGEYDITTNDEMEIVRNITIVGESGVILNAVTQNKEWRIFNIYGGSESQMIVTIKNIVLGDETWTKKGLWIRNDLNGLNKNTNNGCNLTVNLENFQCYKAIVDNGEAIYNENGQMGDNITVKMKNCDIRDFNVQAWKNPKSDTYSYIEFDDASNLGIIVDEQYPLTNIFINGKNPKAHGPQTTYVVKE